MNKIFSLPIFAGIIFFDNKNEVLSTVSPHGKITLRSKRREASTMPHLHVPFLRGIEFVLIATIMLLKSLHQTVISPSQKQLIRSEEAPERTIMLSKIILIFVVAFAIFYGIGMLSTHVGFIIFPNSYSFFVKNLSIAFVRTALLYLLLYALTFLPFIKELYKYNQAGNEAAGKAKHRALNYFNILISSLLLSVFVICLLGLNLSFGLKVLINALILLASFAIIFELALVAEGRGGIIYKLVAAIGILSTAKPAKTETQVVLGAYNEVKLMQEEKNRESIDLNNDNIVSFSLILGEVKRGLAESGITDPSEVEWLIANVLKCKRFDLKLRHSVTKAEASEVMRVLERRKKGEPLEKIFGETEFYGLRFIVNQHVLTPRSDTEILVEEAIKQISDKKVKVLDLCTGSGAIAVCVAKHTKAVVSASDISEEALNVARQNAKNNGVEVAFKQSDLFERFKMRKFDFILSNPPYIKSGDIAKLDKEVKEHDPHLALDGGESGYDFYEKIIADAPKHLAKNGILMLEIGKGQASKIKKLLTNEFKNIKILRDYGNIQRVVIAEKK